MGGWDGDNGATLRYPDLWLSFRTPQPNGLPIVPQAPSSAMERVRWLSRLQALLSADSDVEGAQLEFKFADDGTVD